MAPTYSTISRVVQKGPLCCGVYAYEPFFFFFFEFASRARVLFLLEGHPRLFFCGGGKLLGISVESTRVCVGCLVSGWVGSEAFITEALLVVMPCFGINVALLCFAWFVFALQCSVLYWSTTVDALHCIALPCLAFGLHAVLMFSSTAVATFRPLFFLLLSTSCSDVVSFFQAVAAILAYFLSLFRRVRKDSLAGGIYLEVLYFAE